MVDQLTELTERVRAAADSGTPVYIRGGNSKRNLVGRDCTAQELDVGGHCGVIDYQPEELVISARAGTRISDLAATLAEHGQVLPFEPPQFAGAATLGGTLASNLSGPARPWLGSVRDAVLGLQLINGQAQVLNAGGKVMKNVAGYDISRLQAGALGTLGLITTVHLRVLPAPESTLTLSYDMTAADAVQTMCTRAARPGPLTGACWVQGRLFLRLAGAARAVQHTSGLWGGEPQDNTVWEQLREMAHPFFLGDGPLWRLSTAPNAPISNDTEQCIDWGGAQRWLRCEAKPGALPDGAHVSLFAGGDRNGEVRGTLDSVQQRLQQRLKNSFDPAGLFNPGRLYSWM